MPQQKHDPDTLAKQVCFVVMPFGKKPISGPHGTVDFDRVYESAIKPAIESAALRCIRADEEQSGGVIHSAMFSRLLLSEFVVADLTMANPNVFYELGIRHAAKRNTTIPIYSPPASLPFDVAPLRVIPYRLTAGVLEEEDARNLQLAILERIRRSLVGPMTTDSPLFELLPQFPGITIDPQLTDVFAERAAFADRFSSAIEAACTAGDSKVAAESLLLLESSLGDVLTVDHGLLIRLFMAYRQAAVWPAILGLFEKVPPPVQRYAPVRRAYAMALCRHAKRSVDDINCGLAELTRLLREEGEDVQTYGAIGRVHVDLMRRAEANGNTVVATGHLTHAIDSFERGFLIDPTDTYTGINLVLLLFEKGDNKSKEQARRLVPVVQFAVARQSRDDTWNIVTEIELAALVGDEDAARQSTARLVSAPLDGWELVVIADQLERLSKNAESNQKLMQELALTIRRGRAA